MLHLTGCVLGTDFPDTLGAVMSQEVYHCCNEKQTNLLPQTQWDKAIAANSQV